LRCGSVSTVSVALVVDLVLLVNLGLNLPGTGLALPTLSVDVNLNALYTVVGGSFVFGWLTLGWIVGGTTSIVIRRVFRGCGSTA
jgi:hypothetical protein